VALLQEITHVLTSHRTPGRPAVLGLIAALAVSILPGAPVQSALAAPTELFISEYIEGTSNNKALEIYNGTGAAIDLAADAYDVQMFFNGNPVSTLTIPLTGTVANGDVFVLAQAAAGPTILGQADQTNGSGWFNGDDAVALRKGTTIIDVVGQIGFDPGTEWGTGLLSTADNTLRRRAAVEAGDPNGADAFDPSLQWDGFATDIFAGLGAHPATVGDDPPKVLATTPTNAAIDVPPGSNLTVTFSEPVTTTAASFRIECPPSSGLLAFTLSSDAATVTLNPTQDLPANTLCGVTVVAAQVTDQDGTADPMTTSVSFGFTTGVASDPCADPFTPIYSIQGSGPIVAITGNVTTEGVVVGDFEGPTTGGLQGFYLQDPTGDGDPATSDGIFVFTGDAFAVASGDLVRVTGFARERFPNASGAGQTSLNGTNSNSSPVTAIVNCGTSELPAPVDVTLPNSTATSLEPYEGMLVRFPQTLVISEYFNYDQFGEIVLALPLAGETRPFTGTAIDQPGDAANARTLANSLRRITLDDTLAVSNPPSLRHPNGLPFSLDNMFRGGDTVANAVGVLGFDFSQYRIQPTQGADYTSVNPRPAAPEPVGGTLRAAAMNTLNFFITPDYPTGNPLDNKCGPANNVECRGADFAETQEFTRQRTKLLQALIGLDADIIGLNEIENSTGVEPLGDPVNGVVAGLNAILGPGTYDYIDTGVIGTDAIRVGLIYKPAKVQPVGNHAILTSAVDSRFIDTRSRPVLAQTFEEVGSGARITVAVNHLKSKGSACADIGDPDLGDGQGNCNGTRTAAAEALVDWLATDPTGSGDRDYLILGDLNSYAQEDPIDAIKAGSDGTAGTADDYTNLIAKYQGTFAHSYVFDGQAGYLDHALASQTLVGQVTGAADWHINSDEPDVVDYDTSFKPADQEALYEPNAYRSSDHDPVVVGLNLLNYEFSGFFSPVDNPPVVNTVNAGRTIPMKFSLSGDLGLDVLFGTPTSTIYSCESGLPTDEVETTSTAGNEGLTFDPASGQYTYAWNTQKPWATQCRTFELTLDDGSYHTADFRFR
jgi:predicted extracellular nuclease